MSKQSSTTDSNVLFVNIISDYKRYQGGISLSILVILIE